ncbi:hypothetical protein E2562_016781, partial [Oryza meyeriana var. granulata]
RGKIGFIEWIDNDNPEYDYLPLDESMTQYMARRAEHEQRLELEGADWRNRPLRLSRWRTVQRALVVIVARSSGREGQELCDAEALFVRTFLTTIS